MADSIAFGGRFYKRRKGYAYDHSLTAVLAPILLSVNFDQGDVAGDGQSIVLTGQNLANAVGVSFGGTAATITANTATTVTCTLPAKSAGVTTVTVSTLGGGTSNGLSFEFWAPTTDSSVRLVYDSIHTPYIDSTGTWTPRYCNPRVTGGLTGVMRAYDGAYTPSTGPVASSGAPAFDGDGLNEYGLTTASTDTWDEFIGAVGPGGYQPGTVAIVYTPTGGGVEAYNAGAPYTHDSAIGCLDGGSGIIGLGAVVDDGGTTKTAAHIYDGGGYRSTVLNYNPLNLDTALLSRWGDTATGTWTVSINGSLTPGNQYVDVGLFSASPSYTPFPIDMGYQYSTRTLANQVFIGTIKAAVIADSRVSDTFVTKYYKWAKQRFGVL